MNPSGDSRTPPDVARPAAMMSSSSPPALGAEDSRVLDLLVGIGLDPARVAELDSSDRLRAEAILRHLGALDAWTVEPPHESLVDATLARIDRYEADREAALRIGSGGRPRRRMRLADILGVAAMLMLASAVALPMLSQMRASSLAAVCANNLRTVASGLTAYAADSNGSMPVLAGFGALESLLGGPRASARPQALHTTITQGPNGAGHAVITPIFGTPRHSQSLALLVTTGHCSADVLQCPGCAKGEPCFAYRVPAVGTRFLLNTTKPMVVVADANPVLELRLNGQRIESAQMSSRNHGDRGQNMLFSDGAVDWRVSPVLTIRPGALFDNIWLPRDTDGRERPNPQGPPLDPDDNFVAQ